MYLESKRFPLVEQPPGLDLPPESRLECSCECPNCKDLRDRLEKLSYCLAVAQQLADLRP